MNAFSIRDMKQQKQKGISIFIACQQQQIGLSIKISYFYIFTPLPVPPIHKTTQSYYGQLAIHVRTAFLLVALFPVGHKTF